MKLRISEQQDEEDRPTCLTLDFFSSLMTTESKRSGVFQILSFTRKRQRVFSTKLNDGFFMLKVMFVNEAADQLQSGLIKENYLLSGGIRNHGEGVVVVKETVKFWQYAKQIGHYVAWRHKKENVNYKGSNLVTLTTQKMKNLHGNATQIMMDYGIQASSKKKQTRMSNKKQSALKKQDQSFEKRIDDEMDKKNFTEQSLTKSVIIDKVCDDETQQVTPRMELDKKIATPKKTNKDEKFKTILQLLASDSWSDSDQEILILPRKKSQKKFSTNKKRIQQRKKDLQFIFNCLSDSQQQKQNTLESRTVIVQVEPNQQNIKEADNDDWDILEWIQQKRNSKSLRTYSQKEDTTINQKISCEKLSKNKSINSFENSKETQIDKQKIPLQNLYNGYVKKSASWHCEALIKCIHNESQSTLAIICDIAHQYLIFASFLHTNSLSFILEQGQIYKFGNGVIRQSLNQRVNCSNFDIEFDCRSCILQEKANNKIQDSIQPSQNYTAIQKIYQIEEGLIINCFGILKDFKSFKGKTGNTLHFQIVDPISRWSINYVQFQSRINPESIRSLINSSITIIGAMTSSYKNKPNLVRKNTTIVRHGWLPLSKEAREVADWLGQSNSVTHLETELTGYSEVNDLRDVQDEIGNNFFIKNVEIIEFKDKYTYRACRTCMKKVQDNRCRNCGLRKQGQIEDRLFLRGEIGDLSATMSVIWSNSLAEIMMRDGFAAVRKEWVLRPISVWIDKSSSNTITVVKMKVWRQCQSLATLLDTINRNILK